MFVISTRNFPPDVGGIQSLMGGLSLSLLKHGPVKVFAEKSLGENKFDKQVGLDVTRVSGFKIFRKYRKANLIKEFSSKSSVRAFFFDHWKSIEKIDDKILKNTKSFCLNHSKEINHIKGSLLNKRMLKALNKASFVISNSEFTKKLAIQNGLDEKKIDQELIFTKKYCFQKQTRTFGLVPKQHYLKIIIKQILIKIRY